MDGSAVLDGGRQVVSKVFVWKWAILATTACKKKQKQRRRSPKRNSFRKNKPNKYQQPTKKTQQYGMHFQPTSVLTPQYRHHSAPFWDSLSFFLAACDRYQVLEYAVLANVALSMWLSIRH